MKTNGGHGQITGPFVANAELMNLINLDANKDVKYISKIGIQTKKDNYIRLNGVVFQIGENGILEFENVEITSIRFSQLEDYNTIIDYYYE
jgi:hypothetical protein